MLSRVFRAKNSRSKRGVGVGVRPRASGCGRVSGRTTACAYRMGTQGSPRVDTAETASGHAIGRSGEDGRL